MTDVEKWCKSNNCEYYIEWEFFDINKQPHLCISCKLAGQSYNITKIYKDCFFKNKKELT